METLYNGDIKLKRDKKHVYHVNKGDGWNKVDYSVTGVTDILTPAQPMMWWAVGHSKDYLKNNIQDFADKFIVDGEVDEVGLETFADEVRKAHMKESTRSATVGTIVHKWIEKELNGENPTEPANEQAKRGVESFRIWFEENNVKPIDVERMIYHDRYKYAGTLDLIAKVNGKLALIDFKTSKSLYPSHVFQSAGYQMGVEHDSGEEIQERHLIHIDKENGEFHAREPFTKHKRDKSGFLNCLRLTERKDRVMKEL